MSGKNTVLALLALAALLGGLLDALLRASAGDWLWYNTVLSLCCAILVFAWYHLDSEARGYRRTPLLNIMVVAVGIVAIPYYLVRSRGAQQGLRACGLFLLAVLAWVALAGAGEYLGELLFDR